ncbi:MAG: cytochrome c oxidase assembly protein [Pseudolysinimonas sp.]
MPGRGALLVVLAAIPMGAAIATVTLLGSAPYLRILRGYPGSATAVSSAVLNGVAMGAGALCLAALIRVAFLAARTGKSRMRVGRSSELDVAMWAGIIWFAAAAALTVVDAADANGVSIADAMQPGALAHLLVGSYLPAAWIMVAAIAAIISIVSFVATRWAAVFVSAALAALGLLAPVLVTQVLVGPNHDFGGDASMYGTPAFAVLIGTVVLEFALPSVTIPARVRTSIVASAAVVLAADAVVIPFELAGTSIVGSPTGWLFLAKEACVVAILLLAVVGRVGWQRWTSPLKTTRMGAAAVFAALALGAVIAMTRIPPPQYFVPTSIAQNFLGYDVTAPPTWMTLAFAWRPSILFLVIAVIGVVTYLAAVRRLTRRGDSWPLGRTVAWVLGWVVIVLTTSSGVNRYSGASFSVHMGLHMSLNMLGPLLLVLGGVVTLLLRATTAHPAGVAAGPHEWLNALLHSKLFRLAYNPLYVFVVFIGSYYALYFTPIFDYAMRYHWSHQLMNVHFVVIGYMFYGIVIGVDLPPRPLPYIGKLGLVLAAMPFHAFFGVAVMTSKDIIATTFYHYLDEPWMHLKADQYLGGGIAWSAGELPLIIVVVALVTQWARQDARLARRTDRHLDEGTDTSFDAYNDMLARFSERKPADSEKTP